jgi:hypothetical protein
VFLGALAVFVGCSAQGSDADLSGGAPPPDEGSHLPPPSSSGGSSSGETDASTDAKAPKDATVDTGTPAPLPGSACTTADKIYSRQCGACGKQEALCQVADPEAGAGKVSDYSACHDELAGGCAPGEVVTESCGNCGKHTKTCSKYCAWSVAACTGEPVDSCSAGTVAWTVAGCAQAGTFRSRSCASTCGWSGYSACSAADFAVQVPAAVGQIANAIIPLTKAIHTKRVSGACGDAATLSATDQHAVAYVRVVNGNAKAATISLWNAQAPGGVLLDTVLASYAAEPKSDADLKACEKGLGEYCDTSALPCGDSQFGSLTGTNAVVIPANETRIIAITAANPAGSVGHETEGTVVLGVRVDTLN